jgi:hypothetical protein
MSPPVTITGIRRVRSSAKATEPAADRHGGQVQFSQNHVRRIGRNLRQRLFPVGGFRDMKVEPIQIPRARLSNTIVAFCNEHRRVFAWTILVAASASGHATPVGG